MTRKWLIACGLALALALTATAQDALKPAPAVVAKGPTLTADQRQAFTNLFKDLQLAQLQERNIQLQIALLAQSAQVPEWDLDLQQLAYVPKKKEK